MKFDILYPYLMVYYSVLTHTIMHNINKLVSPDIQQSASYRLITELLLNRFNFVCNISICNNILLIEISNNIVIKMTN